jgi:flagellar biosynthesis protein FlhF
MRMKLFCADSMPQAIKMVRAELGENAIIISSQKGDNGRGVRVTAAVDGYDEPEEALPPVDQPLDAIESIADALDRHGTPGVLAERLLKAASPLAEKLLRAASALAVDAPIMTMAAALDSLYGFAPLPERDMRRPVALIGPPGSGKTVTVAKLAARAVLANRPVKVITTDTMRAGGVDQLAAFTRILDLDLQTALDPDSLVDALTAARLAGDDGLILIDTGGTNPFDAAEVEELRAMLTVADLDITLVLPAGYDCEEAAETAKVFGGIGARRLLITRLDAARRLGSVLVAADVARLKFCDLSMTPHVADGLRPLNPVSLARLLLPEIPPATAVVASLETAKS